MHRSKGEADAGRDNRVGVGVGGGWGVRVTSGRGQEMAGQGGRQGMWTWGHGVQGGWARAGAVDGDGGAGEVGEAGLAQSVSYQVRLWAQVGSGWEGAFRRRPRPHTASSRRTGLSGVHMGGAGVDDDAGRKRERLEGIRGWRWRRRGMARQQDEGSEGGPEDEG